MQFMPILSNTLKNKWQRPELEFVEYKILIEFVIQDTEIF